MALAIRRMTADDLEPLVPVVNGAYRRSTTSVEDLHRYLCLHPTGWLVAEWNGSLAGMVGDVDYGSRAWVGLMAVDPPLQGRGIARALMEALLHQLDQARCPTVVLDASEAGAPLYEKLGFVDIDLVDAYRSAVRPSSPSSLPPAVAPLRDTDLAETAALDAAAFGHDRSAVIASFLADDRERAFVHREPEGAIDGYLIAQPLRIGPWAASSPAAAGALLSAALTLPYLDEPSVLIPRANTEGIALLEEQEFTRQRCLRHMRRGAPLIGDRRDLRYGQASFTLG
ncbi:MAG: GNAT family N-acetyltransferase [Chloroflexota bacterium]